MYARYIYKVSKKINKDISISVKTIEVFESLVYDWLNRIASEAGKVVRQHKKKTLCTRAIQTAVRLVLRGDLKRHAVSAGTRSVTTYNTPQPQQRSCAAKYGLVFSVGRVKTFLKKGGYAPRVGYYAHVYLAAVIEYLVTEVLELAIDSAICHKKTRITPRYLLIAIKSDEELDTLIFGNGGIIPCGGVIPSINNLILGKKAKVINTDIVL